MRPCYVVVRRCTWSVLRVVPRMYPRYCNSATARINRACVCVVGTSGTSGSTNAEKASSMSQRFTQRPHSAMSEHRTAVSGSCCTAAAGDAARLRDGRPGDAAIVSPAEFCEGVGTEGFPRAYLAGRVRAAWMAPRCRPSSGCRSVSQNHHRSHTRSDPGGGRCIKLLSISAWNASTTVVRHMANGDVAVWLLSEPAAAARPRSSIRRRLATDLAVSRPPDLAPINASADDFPAKGAVDGAPTVSSAGASDRGWSRCGFLSAVCNFSPTNRCCSHWAVNAHVEASPSSDDAVARCASTVSTRVPKAEILLTRSTSRNLPHTGSRCSLAERVHT
eukprot:m.1142609 g.1142609  ORF g.1142609 m.1142609 type:complete len:333 (+) comp24455_c0_seq18:1898-2896(+)